MQATIVHLQYYNSTQMNNNKANSREANNEQYKNRNKIESSIL